MFLSLSSGKMWSNISGGRISIPSCGAIDSTGSGYAAFFNETGVQYIETQSLDLVEARSVGHRTKCDGSCNYTEWFAI